MTGWIRVRSSIVAAVRYDDDKAWLDVKLRNGTGYRYFGVARAEFEGMLRSPSAGTYYNTHVKRHRFLPLPSEE